MENFFVIINLPRGEEMVRKNRIVAYGTIYHIINRGKKHMLKDYSDKIKFLACLGAAKEKYDFFLLGYCLMDDDYHLVVKTHNISISKIMQSINTRYGKHYSAKYKKSPFKGRFKSNIIKEGQLSTTINYIHNLPIDYNLVGTIDEYPFTSHAFYQMNVDSIVDIEYLLNLLSSNRISAIDKYSRSMALDKDYKAKDRVYSNTMALDKLLREICPNHIDFELIKNGSKKSYLMDFKKKFIQEAKDLGYSTKEIGGNINISDRAVRKHINIMEEE